MLKIRILASQKPRDCRIVKKGNLIPTASKLEIKKELSEAFSSRAKSTIKFKRQKFLFLRVNIALNQVLRGTPKRLSYSRQPKTMR
jgi:EAL domain-containing protein (putative c-di-GMP-specific phosphodiesterase class I)